MSIPVSLIIDDSMLSTRTDDVIKIDQVDFEKYRNVSSVSYVSRWARMVLFMGVFFKKSCFVSMGI